MFSTCVEEGARSETQQLRAFPAWRWKVGEKVRLDVVVTPAHSHPAFVVGRASEAEQMKQLHGVPARHLRIDLEGLHLDRVAFYTGKPMHDALQTQVPQCRRQLQPDASNGAHDEEPVLALLLIFKQRRDLRDRERGVAAAVDALRRQGAADAEALQSLRQGTGGTYLESYLAKHP